MRQHARLAVGVEVDQPHAGLRGAGGLAQPEAPGERGRGRVARARGTRRSATPRSARSTRVRKAGITVRSSASIARAHSRASGSGCAPIRISIAS